MRSREFLAGILILAIVSFSFGCQELIGANFDLFRTPRAVCNSIYDVQSENVELGFYLIDPTGVQARVEVSYSTDGGATFTPVTGLSENETDNLDTANAPGVYHTITWDSLNAGVGIADVNDRVMLRVVPYDATGKLGAEGQTNAFRVDNTAANERPELAIYSPLGTMTGVVEIEYTLKDLESNLQSVSVYYTIDNGTNWYPATLADVGEGVENLSSSPEGVFHSFNWDSRTDGVGKSIPADVKIRMTPSDFHSGDTEISDEFTVNNQSAPNPPMVSLTQYPAGTVDTRDVTFAWTSFDCDGVVEGYYYALDDPRPSVWTGDESIEFQGLSAGKHTFYIAAKDDDNLVSQVISKTFTVEVVNQKPTAEILSGPTGVTANPVAVFTFQGQDADGTVVKYYVRVDNDPWIPTSLTEYTTGALLDGAHTFKVQAEDNDGERSVEATRSFTVMTNSSNIPPQVTVTGGPNGETTDAAPTFTFSGFDNDGSVVKYYVGVDTPVPTTETTSTSWSPSSALSLGFHTFYVQAEDDQGERSPAGSRSFVVVLPNQAPTVEITGGPTGTTMDNTPTFTYSGTDLDGDVVGYYVSIDDATPQSWTTSTSYTPSLPLEDGAHTFYVQAKDDDGSTSTVASRSFYVNFSGDNVAPTVTITDGPSGNITDTTPTFTYEGSDPDGTIAGFYVSIDNSNPGNWTTSTTYTSDPLANGYHTFYVKARDDEGAHSEVESMTFYVTVANSAPTVTITGGPTGNTADTTPTFTYSGADSDGTVAGFYVSIDDPTPETWTTSTSMTPASPLSFGVHTFYVQAKDDDGATSGVESRQFTVIDTGNDPPTVTITGGPTGTTSDTTPTFTFDGSDSDGTVTGFYVSIDDPTPGTWTTSTSYTSSALSDGPHTFYVQAKDDDDGLSSVASRGFTVDTGGIPGDVIYVDGSSGNDMNNGGTWAAAVETIQQGLDLASNGYTVMVADGTYSGASNRELDFGGKTITLRSQNGYETCIIDGLQTDSRAVTSIPTGATVKGFTMKRFRKYADGGAVYIMHADPTIEDCYFEDNWINSTTVAGGAIYMEDSEAVVKNCYFINNHVETGTWEHGGAICIDSSDGAEITNCVFRNNSAIGVGGAIHCCAGTSATIVNCLFDNNSADRSGAIEIYSVGTVKVINCTFTNNHADANGGCFAVSSGPLYIKNTIMWNNTAGSNGDTIYRSSGSVYLDYCCYESGSISGTVTANDCINTNPQFEAGSYELTSPSPCLDSGCNTYISELGITVDLESRSRIVDGDENGVAVVDMGAYEFQTEAIDFYEDFDDGTIDSKINILKSGATTHSVTNGKLFFDQTSSKYDAHLWYLDEPLDVSTPFVARVRTRAANYIVDASCSCGPLSIYPNEAVLETGGSGHSIIGLGLSDDPARYPAISVSCTGTSPDLHWSFTQNQWVDSVSGNENYYEINLDEYITYELWSTPTAFYIKWIAQNGSTIFQTDTINWADMVDVDNGTDLILNGGERFTNWLSNDQWVDLIQVDYNPGNSVVIYEQFDDGTLDSRLGIDSAGTCTMFECASTGTYIYDEGTSESDASCMYLNDAIDFSQPFIFKHRVRVQGSYGASQWNMLKIHQSASPQLCGPSSSGEKTLIGVFMRSYDRINLVYRNDSDTLTTWNPDTQSWSTSYEGIYDLTTGEYYTIEIHSDGSGWYMILKDKDEAVITQTSTVSWSAIYSGGTGSFWAVWGDMTTNYFYGDGESDYLYLQYTPE